MPTIRALETTYRGITFRSRLEARWATFFDGLGIRYEYEPQGYATTFGNYLPDFWLPLLECFAEVKPIALTPNQRGKCHEIAKGTGFPCLLLVGQPEVRWHEAMLPTQTAAPDLTSDWVDLSSSLSERRLWYALSWESTPPALTELCPASAHEVHAIERARSARFGT